MINAKKELIEHIKDRDVDFVSIAFSEWHSEKDIIIKGKLSEVLPMLNFDYYSGLGYKELHGYIWYTNGTWSERCEYDGSEWWEHKVVPDRNEEIEL